MLVLLRVSLEDICTLTKSEPFLNFIFLHTEHSLRKLSLHWHDKLLLLIARHTRYSAMSEKKNEKFWMKELKGGRGGEVVEGCKVRSLEVET